MFETWSKYVAIIALFLTFGLVYLYVYTVSTAPISHFNQNTEAESKIILVWTTYFGKTWQFPSKKWATDNDRHICQFSNDRQLLRTASSVLFHGRDLNPGDIPKERQYWQRWVFLLKESPKYPSNLDGKWLEMSRNFNFNWTMTYSKKADVRIPYGYLLNREQGPKKLKPTNFIENFHRRPKDAVWIVSHCHTQSKREVVVDKMIALGLEIDIFGKCSNKSFDKNLAKVGEAAFFSNYRFRIAFENSICQDYITEKFFYALDNSERFGVVPVVLAGTNHADIISPSAFVTVDYENVTAAVEFMMKFRLPANDPSPFFEWLNLFQIQSKGKAWFQPFSDLCDRLWTLPTDKIEQVDNIRDNFGTCLDIKNIN